MNHDYEDNGDDSVSVQLGALCLYPHAIAAVQHRDYGTEGMPSSTYVVLWNEHHDNSPRIPKGPSPPHTAVSYCYGR